MSDQPVTPTRQLVIPIHLFRNRTARWPHRPEATLGEIFGDQHHVRTDVRGAPAFSIAPQERGVALRTFSALVLTYDLEAEAAYALTRRLGGRAFVLWTAFDHRAGPDDSHHFHVLLPFNRPVSAFDYRVLSRLVDAQLGDLSARVPERKDRRWLLPVCPPEGWGKASVRYGDGAVLDVGKLLGYRVELFGQVG